MDQCNCSQKDFDELVRIAENLRNELNAFRELYSADDPDSGAAILKFDQFERRMMSKMSKMSKEKEDARA